MATSTEERRQLALEKAIQVLGPGSDPGRVVNVAAKFEDYLRGK